MNEYCRICEAQHKAQLETMEEAERSKYRKAIGSEIDGVRRLAERLQDERERNRLLHYVERIEERIGWVQQWR